MFVSLTGPKPGTSDYCLGAEVNLRAPTRLPYSTVLLFGSTEMMAFRFMLQCTRRLRIGRMNAIEVRWHPLAGPQARGCSAALQILGHEIPVDQLVAKGLEKSLTGVPMVDVVGVFPYVSRQERDRRRGKGSLGIRRI